VFFGTADSPVGGPLLAWELRALQHCAGCPVLSSCREEALTVPGLGQYGVVGGMVASQRREERARRLQARHADRVAGDM
jgi:hypothetical protein